MKPGTMAVACSQRKVCWVAAQRSRGPNKSSSPVGLLVGVGPPQRLDANLTAQRDGVDRLVAGGGDADLGGQDRCHRVRFGRHVQHLERQSSSAVMAVAPRCARRRAAKKPSMNCSRLRSAVESPPQQPKSADEFVAGVDGHQEALRSRVAVAVVGDPDQQRFDVVGEQAHPRIAGRPSPTPPCPTRIRWHRPGPGRTPRCGPARSCGRRTRNPPESAVRPTPRRPSAKSGNDR